jgi:AbrB family looped-hinge helix DNA binding protein
MHRTVVNSRGQVTIPFELRRKLEIKRGTRVAWHEEKGRLVLSPMTARRIQRNCWISQAQTRRAIHVRGIAHGARTTTGA